MSPASASVKPPVKATLLPSLTVVGDADGFATGAAFVTMLKFWTWPISVALMPVSAWPESSARAAAPVAASAAACACTTKNM